MIQKKIGKIFNYYLKIMKNVISQLLSDLNESRLEIAAGKGKVLKSLKELR